MSVNLTSAAATNVTSTDPRVETCSADLDVRLYSDNFIPIMTGDRALLINISAPWIFHTTATSIDDGFLRGWLRRVGWKFYEPPESCGYVDMITAHQPDREAQRRQVVESRDCSRVASEKFCGEAKIGEVRSERFCWPSLLDLDSHLGRPNSAHLNTSTGDC